MKFGVREICDVVFKAKANVTIGNTKFVKGQPVLYIDTAKTSTLEGAATTVYAQGGIGNTRLIAWEGEKTLTFTVEDALLSPIGFAVLSGAGLIKADSKNLVHVHMTTDVIAGAEGVCEITYEAFDDETTTICNTTDVPVFGTVLDGSGSGIKFLGAGTFEAATATVNVKSATIENAIEVSNGKTCQIKFTGAVEGQVVRIDYYIIKSAGAQTITIDAENFAGYYYVEASTLFRRQDTGVDMPAELVIPNVKIQSNFTFTMAASGDPSTFTFTMDAFPGYTMFDRTKKVLCAIQIIGTDAVDDAEDTGHTNHQKG